MESRELYELGSVGILVGSINAVCEVNPPPPAVRTASVTGGLADSVRELVPEATIDPPADEDGFTQYI